MPETTTGPSLGERLSEIGARLDTADEAWDAAGHPMTGPTYDAREAVFADLRAWNEEASNPHRHSRAIFEAKIRRRLADVYDPEGIEVWLRAKNRNLRGFTPHELLSVGDPAQRHPAAAAWQLLRDELDRLTGGMG